MRADTRFTLSLLRMLFQTASIAWLVTTLAAPPPVQHPSYRAATARRHFVSISYDWQYTQPLGFGTHPLEDLLGRPVSEAHLETFQYRTSDGRTFINVPEFSKRGQGIGVTLYPLGSSVGPTLALRGSIEQLPRIRATFEGDAPLDTYLVSKGRAFDIGIGVDISDRAPGWGLGSHAFILAGVGRAQTELRNGSRFFAEAGGGLAAGPLGVDLSVKVAVNRFSDPLPHRFLTIPVSVRGTLTF